MFYLRLHDKAQQLFTRTSFLYVIHLLIVIKKKNGFLWCAFCDSSSSSVHRVRRRITRLPFTCSPHNRQSRFTRRVFNNVEQQQTRLIKSRYVHTHFSHRVFYSRCSNVQFIQYRLCVCVCARETYTVFQELLFFEDFIFFFIVFYLNNDWQDQTWIYYRL